MKVLAALALALLSGTAFAGGEAIVMGPLAEQVEMTAKTAANGDASPFEVRSAGADLQRKVENSRAPVLVGHKWAVERDVADSEANVTRLINAARHRVLLDSKVVPPPVIGQVLDHVSALNDEGRAGIVELPSNVMGLFHYDLKNDPRGEIRLNRSLAQITMLVGDALAASVLVHEGGHSVDEAIGKEAADKSEAEAFKRQYAYLRALYPTGEELTTMRLRLQTAYKKTPTLLNKIAMDFAATCDVLWGLGRPDGSLDESKLQDFIHKLYKPDGSPASSSA